MATPEALVNVPALRQSEPVGRHGDAADDPAIWVDPVNPACSRVLGTNKKQGLLVYDLDGTLLQELPVGRLNNVDVRANFSLGGERVDLAVASNRDRDSIAVFAIDRASGELAGNRDGMRDGGVMVISIGKQRRSRAHHRSGDDLPRLHLDQAQCRG